MNRLLTLTAAADLLGIHRDALRRMIVVDGLPHLHRGRKWLVRADLLDAAIADLSAGRWTPVGCELAPCDGRHIVTLRAVA